MRLNYIPGLLLLIIPILASRLCALPDTLFAGKLFELGLYDDARLEFERIDTPPIDEIDYYIANCYVKSNNLRNAIKQYETIIEKTDDYDLLLNAAIECSAVELYRGNPEGALGCIEKAIDRGAEIDTERIQYLRKIAHNRWEGIDIRPPRRRSPALAQVMSVALPGSGQLYGGDILNGQKSLGVNTALWYLIISAIDGGYYARAITAFYILAPRYWLGASSKAVEITRENNLQDYIRACRQAEERF